MLNTTRAPQRFPLWPIVLVLALLAAGISILVTLNSDIGSERGTSSFVSVEQPIEQEVVPESPVQDISTPVISLVELEWKEIGQARNGEQVRALPIPWDRVTLDLGAKATPDDRVISDAILDKRFVLPPTTDRLVSATVAYLLKNGMVTLYGYSNYGWTEQDPQALTYWKAEIPFSTIKRLSP